MAKMTIEEMKAAAAAKKAGATKPKPGHALPPPPVAKTDVGDAPAIDPAEGTMAAATVPPLVDAAGRSHEELVENEERRIAAGALPTTAGPAEVRQRDPNKKDETRGGQEVDTTDTTTPAEGKTKDASDLAAELEMLKEQNRNLVAENLHLKGTRRGVFEGGARGADRPAVVGKTMRGMIPARTEDIPTIDEINSGVSS